jgi:hypothetical protein
LHTGGNERLMKIEIRAVHLFDGEEFVFGKKKVIGFSFGRDSI